MDATPLMELAYKLLQASSSHVNFGVATMLSWVIEELNNVDFRFLALPTQKLGFLFLKRKNRLAPQIKLSNHSFFCVVPYHGKVVAFFSPII